MTISHTAPPLADVRLVLARQLLAELPGAEDNERPYYWIGRLRTSLRELAAAWPAGASAGMDTGQREVLGQALADAISYRDPAGFCPGCDEDPSGLCSEHAADLDLTDAYLALGNELRIEVQR